LKVAAGNSALPPWAFCGENVFLFCVTGRKNYLCFRPRLPLQMRFEGPWYAHSHVPSAFAAADYETARAANEAALRVRTAEVKEFVGKLHATQRAAERTLDA